MNEFPILAIDGTVASGKSSTAKRLARTLGFLCLDSGSLYRTITWLCLQHKIDVNDAWLVTRFARNHIQRITVTNGVTCLDDKPVGEEIRPQHVSDATSIVSDIPEVRHLLSHIQRGCINPVGLVADGRDMTSVVFKDAWLKVFVTTADPMVRAKRRHPEELKRDPDARIEDVLAKLIARDAKDSSRKCCPLIRTPDSHYIENDTKGLEVVVDELLSVWRQRRAIAA